MTVTCVWTELGRTGSVVKKNDRLLNSCQHTHLAEGFLYQTPGVIPSSDSEQRLRNPGVFGVTKGVLPGRRTERKDRRREGEVGTGGAG